MKLPSLITRKFFPRPIWKQILAVLIILVVVPLVVLGALLIRTSQEASKRTTLQDYKQIVINASGMVEAKVEDARQALLVAASILGTLDADAWRQETVIVELSLRYPMFQRISTVDAKGMETATSELGTELKSRLKETSFQKASTGEPYLSDVIVAEDYMPVVDMAVPIRQRGKIKGVLIAQVNIRGIWSIVDNIYLGETGKACLIDQTGRIIAHPDKRMVLKGVRPRNEEVIQDVLSGKIRSLEIKDAKGNSESLIAFAPIKTVHWGLIVEQSSQEAFSALATMKMQAWVLILLSILAVVLISYILAMFMSRPIRKLIQATNGLAQGNFNHFFRIQRKDEIGRLLFSFNRMARKLQKAQEVEKLSIVGRAATTIAHELKNSLHLVNTFVDLLPSRHKDKKFINEFSNTIPRELDTWNRMLRNMMDFSRQEKIEMVDVDTNVLISDVLNLAKFRVSQDKIHFDVAIESNLPQIRGNADKLKQVFLNLITNALDATPPGGTILMEAGFVDDASAWTTDFVEIKVANSGEGVSIPDMGRIFKPFYTTKSQGLGLGLSICKEIIKQHGGRIEVISEEGKGILFTIQLPSIKFSVFKTSEDES